MDDPTVSKINGLNLIFNMNKKKQIGPKRI